MRPYLARYRSTLLWGLVTVVLSNLFNVALPLFVGRAIDELKAGLQGGSLDRSGVLTYALLVVGFSLVAGVFTFLTRQTIIVVSRHVEFDIRNDFLAHIQKLPLAYFQNTPTGELMALATNDISAVRNALGPGIMYPTDTMMTFTMVLSVMLWADWQLTLLALIPLPFVSVAVYYLGKLVHRKFEERQAQYSALTTRAQENLSGIRVIKTYVREEYETARFREMSWDYLKKNLVLARVQSIMWPLMFLLIGFSLVITLYYGGTSVMGGRLTIGTLTAFFGYQVMLIWPMIAFGWVINQLQQGAASMARLTRTMDTEPEIRETAATDRTITKLTGTIEFRNVTFRHRGAAEPALKDISLTIPAGRTLAVVGYTGSGKSTLVNLIPRMYDVTEGELLIDGVDVRKIPLGVLRGSIGYVPQETFLFSETIAENIAYGAPGATPGANGGAGDSAYGAAEADIMEAAEIARIARDVAEFPKGYATMLGERGITLSGGQKQRTSIARAVMRKPAILILDDALSAVDTYTEEGILSRLRGVMRGRTSIIISHRISTVKDADAIIVLDGGRIRERGTHDELVALGGIYAELHRKQLLEEELEQL
ncbi:MAG TPA: ABC transporter ATP-binding protein, partial [Bacteroidota bacterium]|nr:ABC transporter ATP-binding protein [Bacteroidota bacterium]